MENPSPEQPPTVTEQIAETPSIPEPNNQPATQEPEPIIATTEQKTEPSVPEQPTATEQTAETLSIQEPNNQPVPQETQPAPQEAEPIIATTEQKIEGTNNQPATQETQPSPVNAVAEQVSTEPLTTENNPLPCALADCSEYVSDNITHEEIQQIATALSEADQKSNNTNDESISEYEFTAEDHLNRAFEEYLHSSESSSETSNEKEPENIWLTIDCVTPQTLFKKDGETYLNNRLHEYKKVGSSPEQMNFIKDVYTLITGKLSDFYETITMAVSDDKQNTFLHHAICKGDLDIVLWLLDNNCKSTLANSDGKTPIDTCIEQLLLSSDEDRKIVTLKILDLLSKAYEPTDFSTACRKNCLKLDLEHKKNDTKPTLNECLTKRLLTQEYFGTNQDIKELVTLYQTVTDQDKNTFSHILVQKHSADELYDFITKDYISFAKNSAGKNPLDIAKENFKTYVSPNTPSNLTQSGIITLSQAKNFNPTRCCMLMLINYVKKTKGNSNFEQCCDKHTI